MVEKPEEQNTTVHSVKYLKVLETRENYYVTF